MINLLTAAAEAGAAEGGFGPYIAAGITTAVFLFAAVVVRSFREVRHRVPGADAHGSDHA